MFTEAIKWRNGSLEVLDQLQLPHVVEYIPVKNSDDAWHVIKNMQVRGAPAIALVGCLGLAAELATDSSKWNSVNELYEFIVKKLEYLVTARPTAVNMRNAADALKVYSQSFSEIEELKKNLIAWCGTMLQDDLACNKQIGQNGFEAITKHLMVGERVSIITHCNTGTLACGGYGTALGVVRSLASQDRLEHVYCTETRPYNQGARLTAFELVQDNLPATLICDSMVGVLMKERKINAVIVGADRTAKNGDTANKIGTYQIAVLAKYHDIPFYTAVPTTTIDFSLDNGSKFPIEERPHKEMTSINGIPIAAPGINCWNPAFDVTPAELITGVITEKGVFKCSELKEALHL